MLFLLLFVIVFGMFVIQFLLASDCETAKINEKGIMSEAIWQALHLTHPENCIGAGPFFPNGCIMMHQWQKVISSVSEGSPTKKKVAYFGLSYFLLSLSLWSNDHVKNTNFQRWPWARIPCFSWWMERLKIIVMIAQQVGPRLRT